MLKKVVLGICVLSMFACATTRFNKIAPGMTNEQVVKIMKKGPAEVKAYQDNYAAWYYSSWGEDRSFCLLMQNDKVVSKEKDQEGTSVSVPGLGTYHERSLAECVPPGETAQSKTERSIRIDNAPLGDIRVKK